MKGKHKGNRNSYTDQRDEELAEAFSKAKEYLLYTKGHISLIDALNIARMTPCSRFFVSEERASEIIRAIINSEKKGTKNPLDDMIYQRKRMFSHIYLIYKGIKERYPEYSHEDVVAISCAHPASEFYLTIDSARVILGRIILNSKRNGIRTCKRNL